MTQRQVTIDWEILDRLDQAAAIAGNQVNATLSSFADLEAQLHGLRAHLAQAYELSQAPVEIPPAPAPPAEEVPPPPAPPAEEPTPTPQEEEPHAESPVEASPGESGGDAPSDPAPTVTGEPVPARTARSPRRRKTPAQRPPVA